MGDIEQRTEELGANRTDNTAMVVQVSPRIADVPAGDWDACARGSDTSATSSRPANPFTSHAFLQALEASGSATRASGWLPQHVLLKDGAGRLMGAMPCYLKSHSYGEYVFDHAWADAYERAGGRY
jgi:predicted N-acyltransferase